VVKTAAGLEQAKELLWNGRYISRGRNDHSHRRLGTLGAGTEANDLSQFRTCHFTPSVPDTILGGELWKRSIG
jgi:hypothetical protein